MAIELFKMLYVDDAVFGFQYEDEGRAFLDALDSQVKAYGLALHPTKTRLLEFGRYASSNRRGRGEGKPETFDYLGFTHICGKTRNGSFCIRRKTIRKRFCRTLRKIKEELGRRMHRPLNETGKWLGSVMRGYINYYGIPRNIEILNRAFLSATQPPFIHGHIE